MPAPDLIAPDRLELLGGALPEGERRHASRGSSGSCAPRHRPRRRRCSSAYARSASSRDGGALTAAPASGGACGLDRRSGRRLCGPAVPGRCGGDDDEAAALAEGVELSDAGGATLRPRRPCRWSPRARLLLPAVRRRCPAWVQKDLGDVTQEGRPAIGRRPWAPRFPSFLEPRDRREALDGGPPRRRGRALRRGQRLHDDHARAGRLGRRLGDRHAGQRGPRRAGAPRSRDARRGRHRAARELGTVTGQQVETVDLQAAIDRARPASRTSCGPSGRSSFGSRPI